MNGVALEEGLLTVEDWLQADPPEEGKLELVDGVLEMTPLAELPHQRALFRLQEQIFGFHARNPGFLALISSPARVAILGKRRGREPDLALYVQKPEHWLEARPLVVVEVVSPGAEARDYIEKRGDYYQAEIPEYWIVDPERRLFSALRRTDHGWDEHRFEEAGVYSTPLLPGLELDAAKFWV